MYGPFTSKLILLNLYDPPKPPNPSSFVCPAVILLQNMLRTIVQFSKPVSTIKITNFRRVSGRKLLRLFKGRNPGQICFNGLLQRADDLRTVFETVGNVKDVVDSCERQQCTHVCVMNLKTRFFFLKIFLKTFSSSRLTKSVRHSAAAEISLKSMRQRA